MLLELVLVLSLWQGMETAKVSGCTPATDAQKTSWGHSNPFYTKVERIKRLQGVVVVSETQEPLELVLVEVFDKPDVALRQRSRPIGHPGETGQRRIAACVTDKDGRFSFEVESGKYELRSSRPSGWKATSMVVEVRKGKRNKSDEGLTVPLFVDD